MKIRKFFPNPPPRPVSRHLPQDPWISHYPAPRGFVWPSRPLAILAGTHDYLAWIPSTSGGWVPGDLVAQKMSPPSSASVSPSGKVGGVQFGTRNFLWHSMILRTQLSASMSFSESPGFRRNVNLSFPCSWDSRRAGPNRSRLSLGIHGGRP